MALTLAQLTAPATLPQMRGLVFGALQGLGFVTKTGTGTGGLALSGNPTGAYSAVIRIAAPGELGVATFQYSLDGGATYSAAATIPSSGIYVLGTTGVFLQFSAGPSPTSFVGLDTYAFALATPNFPVTSWQSGGAGRTLVEIEAQALQDLTTSISQIAAGGLLFTSTGSWLDLLALNAYGLTRSPALVTQGTVILADTAGQGPFTIAAGQLTAQSSTGLLFTNLNGGTLNLSGTLALTFQAAQPGSIYNVGSGSITSLVTSLPGVTLTNPAIGGTGSWITSSGADAESDTALQQRCSARWPSLGIGAPTQSYDLWAKAANPLVTRTFVQPDATVPGQVDVYIASAAGAFPDGTVAATVLPYLTARTPLTTTVNVANASAVTVTVTADVYVKASGLAVAMTQAPQNIQALIAGTFLGGTVYKAAIIENLMLPPGSVNVVLASPAADVSLTSSQVATLTLALTWHSV